MTSPAVKVSHLNFSYGGAPILSDLSLELPIGSRCLLVGSNGAGKTTLLRILAGKRMVKEEAVQVLGKDAYRDTPHALTYLGPEWASNPVVRRDVSVKSLLESMNASRYPERCAILIDLLDIDLNWHMHQISDGERRRVQILLGILEPFQMLLLDEVTVDLDVLVRRNLLEFLRRESEGPGKATIVYATHIFDGLGGWPTNIAHIRQGSIVEVAQYDNFPALEQAKRTTVLDSPLLTVVEVWLKEDRRLLKNLGRQAQSETVWDRLSDMRKYGDKYYDYWQEAS